MNFIRKLFKPSRKKRDGSDWTFDEIYADPIGLQIFADHLLDELCIENLMFYERCIDWTDHFDARTEQERHNAAINIYLNHMKNESQWLINLTSDLREYLARTIHSGEVLTKDLFEDAKRQTKYLINDSFQRFKQTQIYRDFINGLKIARRSVPDDYPTYGIYTR